MTQITIGRQRGHSAPGLLAGLAAVGAVTLGLIILFYISGVFTTGTPAKPESAAVAPTPAESAPPADTAAATPAAPSAADSTEVPRVEEPLTATVPQVSELGTTNLLGKEQGGHIVKSDNKKWLKTIDGDDKAYARVRGEAVYGFKDDGVATFDAFSVTTPGKSKDNLHQFELMVSDESPEGPFRSLGTFQVQNIKAEGDGHQVVKFQMTTAKYLKVKILTSYGPSSAVRAYEFQLIGRSGGQ